MSLALALGVDDESLSRKSERWLRRWQRYEAKHAFPSRRLEFYLANIARLLAGNKDMKLTDFMFDPKEKPAKTTATATIGALAIGNLSGVGFRKLGQGRKKKAT